MGRKYRYQKRDKEINRLRYEEGWSYQEIADYFNMTHQRISQITGKSNISTSKVKVKKRLLAKKAILDNPGLNLPELEKKTGIDTWTFSVVRKLLGINGVDRTVRFWMYVDRKGDDDCWEWIGNVHPKMLYGRYRFDGKIQYSHRVVWQIINGKITKEKQILHTCDNPVCVNPKHLYLGTCMDNMRDRDVRGRNGKALLSLFQVRLIRYMDKKYQISIKEFSAMFGVNYPVMRNVIKNKTYKYA